MRDASVLKVQYVVGITVIKNLLEFRQYARFILLLSIAAFILPHSYNKIIRYHYYNTF